MYNIFIVFSDFPYTPKYSVLIYARPTKESEFLLFW